MSRKTNFSFSPSVHHGHMMDTLEPSMTYRDDDLKPWQQELRRKVRQLVGDMPEERVSLNVRTVWKRDHPLGSIEKIVFTSEPYSDVPAYVCLPNEPGTALHLLHLSSRDTRRECTTPSPSPGTITPRPSKYPETGTSASGA